MRVTSKYGRVSVLAFTLGIAVGCASVPHIDPVPAPSPNTTPQIRGPRGPLTAQESKALLARSASEPGDAGLLQRHVAIEQEVSDSALLSGNRTKILRDGAASFGAMFSAMKSAVHNINLEYYIFEDIESNGAKLGDLLIAKAKAGVSVNVIYDSFGSAGTPAEFFDSLKAGGVKLVSFNPVNPLESRTGYAPNDRDHRKILVVDGRTAIVGGVNLSASYENSAFAKSGAAKGAAGDPWRDTDLQIDGPAVGQLQKLFVDHWKAQKGPALDLTNMFPAIPVGGTALVRTLGSTPANATPEYYVTLLSAIRNAEKSIMVSTAYFVPTDQEIEDLIGAAKRGVDVRLMLPSKSDSPKALAVGHSHYSELLAAGVKIFEMQNFVLHSKTVVIDGVWSVIGSSNFDHRSVIFNDEVDVVVLGSDTAQDMEALFQADQSQAKAINLTAWKKRPFWDRLTEFYAVIWETWL